ncbi:MAG: serine peptidase, partial [Variovorax sp.]|nr:serine peptidase [Variovorax sp.]
MPKIEWKRLRSCMFVCALAVPVTAVLLPVNAAVAQVRSLPDFADLAEQVGPSVVNIRTIERVAARGNDPQMDEEMQEFFRRFFGQPLPDAPRSGPGPGTRPNRPQVPQEEQRPRGVGSGFILTGDGYVMTNAHVVEDASEVMVTLPDKREFKARVVGFDKRTDVAVLKIDATGLPAVKVGDITKLRVGEWVIAIGS